MRPTLTPAQRLMIGLDADAMRSGRIASALLGRGHTFKIGHKTLYRGGMEMAEELVRARESVFLDLKLHDIETTVEDGIRSIADKGFKFVTVHGYVPTVAAALRGAEGSDLTVLSVTVLTSLDDALLAREGYGMGAAALVARRAGQAAVMRVKGIVCAASDLHEVRDFFPGIIVTPGVRMHGEDRDRSSDEHKRTTTIRHAISEGADYIVLGRPIVEAQDPASEANRAVRHIEAAENEKARNAARA